MPKGGGRDDRRSGVVGGIWASAIAAIISIPPAVIATQGQGLLLMLALHLICDAPKMASPVFPKMSCNAAIVAECSVPASVQHKVTNLSLPDGLDGAILARHERNAAPSHR
jgi:hypothetical protein